MTWLSNEIPNGGDFAPRVPTAFCRLEVRPKSNDQRGVFACENIYKGTTVFRDGGVVVPMSIPKFPKYGYSVVIDEGLMLAPRDYDNMESIYFLNHNCDSNLARIGGLIYVAKKEIRAGDELTVDYSPLLADYKEDWSLDCDCLAAECRHKITSRDYRNPDLAIRLWDEWLPFIQRKINR